MMQNLSMHVLDIAANSVRAKATKVSVAVVDSELRNQIKITVSDNGCGTVSYTHLDVYKRQM